MARPGQALTALHCTGSQAAKSTTCRFVITPPLTTNLRFLILPQPDHQSPIYPPTHRPHRNLDHWLSNTSSTLIFVRPPSGARAQYALGDRATTFLPQPLEYLLNHQPFLEPDHQPHHKYTHLEEAMVTPEIDHELTASVPPSEYH